MTMARQSATRPRDDMIGAREAWRRRRKTGKRDARSAEVCENTAPLHGKSARRLLQNYATRRPLACARLRGKSSTPLLRAGTLRIRIRFGDRFGRWLVVNERGDTGTKFELDLEFHGQTPLVLRNPDSHRGASPEHP